LNSKHYPAGSLALLLTVWIAFRVSANLLFAAATHVATEKAVAGNVTAFPAKPVNLAKPFGPASQHSGLFTGQLHAPALAEKPVPNSPRNNLPSPSLREMGQTLPSVAALDGVSRASSVLAQPSAIGSITPPPARDTDARPRLKLSGWAIWRNAPDGTGLAAAGQLGGSQAGLRATLPVLQVGQSLELGLNGRASSPLRSSKGKEVALGLSFLRSGSLPIEIGVERRLGAREAFAMTAATGVNDRAIGPRLKLSGYGQAGLVGMRRRDAFIDGALQIDRTIVSKGNVEINTGIGIWGAAQPGLYRMDVGPQTSLKLSKLRISGQWRFRVAGDAQPGSGPAITIGADF
jgi:hypothetical protein